jgi:hypothetical protein
VLRRLRLRYGCGSGAAIIAINEAKLTVEHCLIAGNNALADEGGGIYAFEVDEVYVNYTSIVSNTAAAGGGIYIRKGKLTINNSTVSGNSADSHGGGIALYGDLILTLPSNRVTLNNSTVSGNTATDGGGVAVRAFGTTPSILSLYSSTITNNDADQGGGIYTEEYSGAELLVFTRNSIVAAQARGDDCYDNDAAGTPAEYISSGYNIERATSCDFTATGDQQGILDPGLYTLGDYGGRTSTHILEPDSPAIDGGDPSGCYGDLDGGGTLDTVPLYYDQRGEGHERHNDGNLDGSAICDIGAVEMQIIFFDGFESGDTSTWSYSQF